MNINNVDFLEWIIQIKERVLDSVLGYFVPTKENRQQWRNLLVKIFRPISSRLSLWVDRKIKDDTISVSNLFSASRIPAGIIFLIFYENNISSVNLIGNLLYTTFSDFADGWFARKMNTITEFGKKFDAACDKFYAGCAIIALWSKLYWWSIYPLIILDVILFLSVRNEKRLKKYFPNFEIASNKYGRWKVTIQCIGALMILFNQILLGNYILILANIFALGSIIRHLKPENK